MLTAGSATGYGDVFGEGESLDPNLQDARRRALLCPVEVPMASTESRSPESTKDTSESDAPPPKPAHTGGTACGVAGVFLFAVVIMLLVFEGCIERFDVPAAVIMIMMATVGVTLMIAALCWIAVDMFYKIDLLGWRLERLEKRQQQADADAAEAKAAASNCTAQVDTFRADIHEALTRAELIGFGKGVRDTVTSAGNAEVVPFTPRPASKPV